MTTLTKAALTAARVSRVTTSSFRLLHVAGPGDLHELGGELLELGEVLRSGGCHPRALGQEHGRELVEHVHGAEGGRGAVFAVAAHHEEPLGHDGLRALRE